MTLDPQQTLLADRRIARALFVLAAVTFSYFFGGAGWNQDAHFDLTRAIVERQTLYIDGYDVNTGDVSRGRGGHIYINKPPGVSFLAAIPYAIAYAVEKAARAPVDHIVRTNAWIVTAATTGVSGALIAPLLYLYGRRRHSATPREAVEVALVVVFGTIVFAYSTMLFSHVPAALFVLASFAALRWRPLVAGMAAGAAITCFYVCAATAAIVAIAAARRSWRSLGAFALGAAPFLLLLAAYHWHCFGSPFRTAVEASVSFTDERLLFGVLQMPRVDALYGITFSPYRGVFAASPVLLFAFAGGVAMARNRELRFELFVCTAMVVAFFLFISSFNFWSGGWAFGPRYVLPVIPLFGIPMFFAVRSRHRGVRTAWIAAAVLSAGLNFIATSTDPMPSPEVRDPIRRYLLPAFFNGRIPEESRRAFPWYGSRLVDKTSLPRDSGNLGEFVFGEGRRMSVLPIALWLVGGSAALLRRARDQSPSNERPGA